MIGLSLLPTRHRSFATTAVFAFSASLFASAAAATADMAKVQEFFAQLHAKGEFNGSVLIADASGIQFHAAYGLANEETRAKLEPDTPHRIASVTKGFTAVLALQAAERGEIDLDARMLTHFPGLDRPPLAGITIRHLLTHSSGLVDFAPTFRDGDSLGAALTRALATAEVAFPPGAKFAYVNVGYTIVSHMLELATKRSYAELLQERILKPAGMEATYIDIGGNLTRPRALGYEPKNGALVLNEESDLMRFTGAGGIVSTTGDLHRFSRALAGDALLSAANRKLLQTPQKDRYAMGCAIMTTPTGEVAQLFLGNMPSTSAVLARFNDGQWTIIILSNRYRVPLNRLIPQVHRLLPTAP